MSTPIIPHQPRPRQPAAMVGDEATRELHGVTAIAQGESPAPPVHVPDAIARLRQLRETLAGFSRRLAERELEARVLRLTIETEMRQAGTTKTDAETRATADPRYLDHKRESIQLTYNHAVLEADAEALVFAIRHELATAERLGAA